MKPDCYTCVHRHAIPGDAHSSCDMGRRARVTAQATGMTRGWVNWPSNFDPVWLVSCDSWMDKKAEDEIVRVRERA
jgi:hypothetical protein